MAISHCYWHLVVQNSNSHCYWHLLVQNGTYALLLTSSHPEWQFHIATDLEWSRIAISHCYWHLVVKNGNFTLLLTSSRQEWQFHIATYWHLLVRNRMALKHCITDIYWAKMAISLSYWPRVVKNGTYTLLLTSSGQEWQFNIATDI